MSEPAGGVVELSDDRSWELLRRNSLGRLAYHLADEVHIAPVNYAVMDDRVLFRTTAGSKLVAVIINADVAFEVDELDPETLRATSVVARGVASRLDLAQIRALGAEGPHPWVGWETDEVVAIRLTTLSGRSFVLQRPDPAHGTG